MFVFSDFGLLQKTVGKTVENNNSDGSFLSKCIVQKPFSTITDESFNVSIEHYDEHIPSVSEFNFNNVEDIESVQEIESRNNGLNKELYSADESFDSNNSDLDLQTIKNRQNTMSLKISIEKVNTDVLIDKDHAKSPEKDQEQTINMNAEKQSRKRKRSANEWKRNVKKKNCNSGEEYYNAGNKLVPKKKLKTPCNEKCRYKCYTVFSEEEREGILKSFWAIGDNTRQRQYISSNIENIENPKYRYPKENSNRSFNQAYFLIKEEKKIRVCKKFFMATLDIGDTMIRTTIKKRDTNLIVGPDKRGTHNKHQNIGSSSKE